MSTEAPTPTPTPEQAPLSTQDSALSTGSQTSPKAKSRSRLNAFKHGLTAQQFVFSPEEAEAYKAQADQIHKHYEPHGPVEEALVRQIADGIWRLDRASAMEHSIFANAIDPNRNRRRRPRPRPHLARRRQEPHPPHPLRQTHRKQTQRQQSRARPRPKDP